MNIQISVPVKEHVKHYLVREFGSQYIPINLYQQSLFSSKVYDLLTRPKRYLFHPIASEKYSEQIIFLINPKTQHVTRAMSEDTLSIDKVYSFNRFVELLIEERLFIMLDTLQLVQKVKIKNVINAYLERNNLTDAYSYDTLKKAYYRYRLSAKQAKQTWNIPTDNLVPKSQTRAA